MTGGFDHFWCQILWSAAESVRHTILWLFDLTQSEVCQLEMSLKVKQYILGFQVAVDDAVFVEVGERQYNLSCIESSPIF